MLGFLLVFVWFFGGGGGGWGSFLVAWVFFGGGLFLCVLLGGLRGFLDVKRYPHKPVE